ncbi:MAG: NAD(P)/FAD-dependent oxidoreductase [Myxococcota bacterium]|nr:NAD(P)/FAD-dependent oxidoreductase [Myxococcota bacterium]
MSDFDAAVIGSGPNGLSAAVALAQTGRRVVVYEAQGTIGGSARTSPLTLPGFRHDVCSAIHPMAAISPALSVLPLADHGLRWIHPEAPLAHPFDDAPAVLLERTIAATAATMGDDGPRYTQWMRPLLSHWEALIADALRAPGIPKSPLVMARFGLWAVRPAAMTARSVFKGERGQGFFAGMAGHAVMPMERVASSAIGLMLTLAGHAAGWPFPEGGAQAIPDALASIFTSLGGVIRTDTRIRQLEDVETDGPVFFQTAPAVLSRIAGDHLPASYRRRLARYRHGPGVFKVDWALSEPIPWRDAACRRAATLHLGSTLGEIAASEHVAWYGGISPAPYVLLAQHSLFDPTRAPPGKHTAWGYCHVESGSPIEHTDFIEAQVERYAPGFRDCILARHTMSAVDFEAYNPSFIGGDINVGAPDLDQLLTRPVARLSPYTTPNPRIFLCSAATPPGGGVHGMAGANAVAAMLSAQ